MDSCYEIAMGGTAVGTGINSIEGFGEKANSGNIQTYGPTFSYG
ncbi:MAG: hypothetical protein CM1200mP10_26540 [Candidatus Neomarinimicrobiota bacterium]|nr:MAG: hypothetical protein CM1200mP10_26540 [Candidatus Neomarinimicrobiota bacterium]